MDYCGVDIVIMTTLMSLAGSAAGIVILGE